MTGFLHSPTISGLRLCVRIVVAGMLSVWIVSSFHLAQPYWAGISAALVVADSFGGSLKTMLIRFGGTVVGLTVAVATVAVFKHHLYSALIAMSVAVLLCNVIGLQGGMRLAGATAMIPIVAVPDNAEFMISFLRATNVLVGSVIGGASGLLVFPELAAGKLKKLIQADVRSAGSLLAESLKLYAETGRADEKAAMDRIEKLRADRQKHIDMLKDMSYEFIERAGNKLAVQGMVVVVHGLIASCIMLIRAADQAKEDRFFPNLAPAMSAYADRIASAAQTFECSGTGRAFLDKIDELELADGELLTALAKAKASPGTSDCTAEELARLMTVLFESRKFAEGLVKLAGPERFDKFTRHCGRHPAV